MALIAHYKMNDNLATDVILDDTGNHNGAVKDATGTATSLFHSVAGKINNAQDFDGTDDYIEIPDSDDFTPALTPLSIDVWVYVNDMAGFEIADKGVAGVDMEWAFNISDYAAYFLVRDESESCHIGRIQRTALTQSQWIHLVVTYDGGTTNASFRIYANGVRVDDANYTTGSGFVSAENSGASIHVGNYVSAWANGYIENLKFFSVVLSADDAKRLHNNGMGTEILSEVDPARHPRRGCSPMGLRANWES